MMTFLFSRPNIKATNYNNQRDSDNNKIKNYTDDLPRPYKLQKFRSNVNYAQDLENSNLKGKLAT